MENDKIKERAISELDKIEESGFDLGDWSIEDAYVAGYKKGFETKINTTTISDCPLPDGDAEKDIKTRMLSQKVYDLQKQSDQLTEAKEIIREFLKLGYGAFSYSTANEIIAKAEAFLNDTLKYNEDLENCRGWHAKENLIKE